VTYIKQKRLILVSVVAVFLLGVVLAMTAHTVKAGSNGQQLSIWTGLNSNRIVVLGRNPAGNLAVYKTTCIKLGFCGLHTTTGWWWKGPVTIRVYRGIYGNNYRECTHVNVPKVWPSNVYRVTCLAP
jgi:hypothetical protein